MNLVTPSGHYARRRRSRVGGLRVMGGLGWSWPCCLSFAWARAHAQGDLATAGEVSKIQRLMRRLQRGRSRIKLAKSALTATAINSLTQAGNL